MKKLSLSINLNIYYIYRLDLKSPSRIKYRSDAVFSLARMVAGGIVTSSFKKEQFLQGLLNIQFWI